MFGIFNWKKLKTVEEVLTRSQRGVHKRIDENRELLELLQCQAPGFLEKHGWVEGWLHSQDSFLSDLLAALPVTNPDRSGAFPRPWPVASDENAAIQKYDITTPKYWGLPDDIVFRVSRGDQTSPIPCTFDQMLDFLDASGLNLARDEAQVVGIIAGIPFTVDGAAMQFEQVQRNGAKTEWAIHAYPLKQITISFQGTRHSKTENMLQQVEEVVRRINGGDLQGESSDDDFGYQFVVDLRSNKPSIFGNAPTNSR